MLKCIDRPHVTQVGVDDDLIDAPEFFRAERSDHQNPASQCNGQSTRMSLALRVAYKDERIRHNITGDLVNLSHKLRK
ncbi:hypothetical protein [Devosia sp. CN2-171]|uniref:hypothetical protein n=1 Tax=Devosia sp. CN2-171 TaxID=3400909 RepID=UPI003BF7FB94